MALFSHNLHLRADDAGIVDLVGGVVPGGGRTESLAPTLAIATRVRFHHSGSRERRPHSSPMKSLAATSSLPRRIIER